MRRIIKILITWTLLSNLLADDAILLGLKAKSSLENLAVGTIEINQPEIEKFHGQSATDILENYAGIRLVKPSAELGSATGIIFRGMPNSNYSLVLLDGQPINTSALGGADLSIIDLNTIEKIEIIKSGNASILGNGAVGGAINFISKQSQTKNQITTDFGSYGYQKFALNMNTNNKKTKLNYGISDTSYLGKRENSNYYSKNFNANLTRNLTENSELKFRYFYQNTDLAVPGSITYPTPKDKMNSQTNLLQTEYKKFIELNELYCRMFVNQQTKNDTDPDVFKNDNFLEKKYGFETRANLENGLVFGYQLEYDEANKYDTLNSANIYNKSRAINSMFIQKQFYSNMFSNVIGIRYDNAGNYGDGFSPQLEINCKLNETWKISSNISKSFKVLGLEDIYWIESSGNKLKYKYEESIGQEFGIEGKFLQKKLVISNVVFKQEIENLVSWDWTNWINPTARQVAQTSSQGFESSLSFKQKYLQHQINYTYTDALIKDDKNSKYTRQPYTAHNRLVYVLDFKITQSLTGLFKFTSVSEQKWETYGTNTRIDDYTIADILFNYAFCKNDLLVYLGIDNIFDEKYELSKDYPIPSRTFKVGLKLKFS